MCRAGQNLTSSSKLGYLDVDVSGQRKADQQSPGQEAHEEAVSSHDSNNNAHSKEIYINALNGGDSNKRQTRSAVRANLVRTSSQSTQASVKSATTADGDEYADSKPVDHRETASVEDGLVPCPICGFRMKEWLVFSHLDACQGGNRPKPLATGALSHHSNR